MYTQWADSTQIDRCKTLITNVNPIPFQNIQFTSLTSNIVQSTFNGQLSLKIARSFYYQDSITLTLPNNFMNAQISSSNFQTLVSSQDSPNTITLNNFPSIPQSLTANNIIIINLNQILNP